MIIGLMMLVGCAVAAITVTIKTSFNYSHNDYARGTRYNIGRTARWNKGK